MYNNWHFYKCRNEYCYLYLLSSSNYLWFSFSISFIPYYKFNERTNTSIKVVMDVFRKYGVFSIRALTCLPKLLMIFLFNFICSLFYKFNDWTCTFINVIIHIFRKYEVFIARVLICPNYGWFEGFIIRVHTYSRKLPMIFHFSFINFVLQI